MAYYKHTQNLQQSNGNAFDYTYGPAQTVPHSGIYKCDNCKREIASNKDDRFPPQNHHQHPNPATPIKWRLIVATA